MGNFLTGDYCGTNSWLAGVTCWHMLCILNSAAVITSGLVISSDGCDPFLDMGCLQGVNRGPNFFKTWVSPDCSKYSAAPLQWGSPSVCSTPRSLPPGGSACAPAPDVTSGSGSAVSPWWASGPGFMPAATLSLCSVACRAGPS